MCGVNRFSPAVIILVLARNHRITSVGEREDAAVARLAETAKGSRAQGVSCAAGQEKTFSDSRAQDPIAEPADEGSTASVIPGDAAVNAGSKSTPWGTAQARIAASPDELGPN